MILAKTNDVLRLYAEQIHDFFAVRATKMYKNSFEQLWLLSIEPLIENNWSGTQVVL